MAYFRTLEDADFHSHNVSRGLEDSKKRMTNFEPHFDTAATIVIKDRHWRKRLFETKLVKAAQLGYFRQTSHLPLEGNK